jgi:hypothetical protein
MLFILAMEPLQKLLSVAASDGLLSPLGSAAAKLRVSLYADDVAVFIRPVKEEVQVVVDILDIFGHVSGLATNRDKCTVYPIHCDEVDLKEVLLPFRCAIQSFPCCYLGLLLHFRQLGHVQVQPLIDKMANRCPCGRAGS